MRHNKIHRWLAPLIFWGVLIVGSVLITSFYSHSQVTAPNEPLAEEPGDRQKQLMSAEGEMSKWLLGLASAALAGLIGLRLKNPGDDGLMEIVPMSAYAFLVLSLYGGFLSYEATLDILRRGPLRYLYGDQFRFPVLVQFWSLVIALILLAVWLFGRKPKAVALAAVLAVFFAGTANAQEIDRQKCVESWYQDRLHVSNSSGDLALGVLQKIEKEPNAKPIRTCLDVDLVLDRLRFAAVNSGKKDTEPEFASYLKTLADELSHPELSMSDVVHSIIDLMSPWDRPVGVLSVRSSKGTFQILLNAAEVGLTNWSARLVPGTYRIRIVKDLKVVYSSNDLQIAANETKIIDLDPLLK
jgi:hypothetical protein